MEEEKKEEIKELFKQQKLPKPITINYIGRWAYGDCYAVTCGLIHLKKYCVYFNHRTGATTIRRRG